MRAAALLLLFALGVPATAQERLLVPRVTLYPGDGLGIHLFAATDSRSAPDNLLREGFTLDGMVARRTLPAGHPVPLAALQSERIIRNGHRVTLVYEDEGLAISTVGQAMEHGGLGETIRVRNAQSGLIVSGRIVAPGRVAVGGT